MAKFIELEVKNSSTLYKKIFGLNYIVGIVETSNNLVILDLMEGAEYYSYTINQSYEEVKALLQGK